METLPAIYTIKQGSFSVFYSSKSTECTITKLGTIVHYPRVDITNDLVMSYLI